MKAIALESFGKFLTKGKKYEIAQDTRSNILIVDDSGSYSGWNKNRFEPIEEDLDLYGWEINIIEFNKQRDK